MLLLAVAELDGGAQRVGALGDLAAGVVLVFPAVAVQVGDLGELAGAARAAPGVLDGSAASAGGGVADLGDAALRVGLDAERGLAVVVEHAA